MSYFEKKEAAAAIEHHDEACGSEILNLKKNKRGIFFFFFSYNPDRLFRIGFPRSSNRNTPFSVPMSSFFYFLKYFFEPLLILPPLPTSS